ncbi:methionine synthase [Nocardioides bruguierae]|uniref:methionine synthase n=1 Tax=Nocardioides bruguierae TaxID=2945102 RepID=UPI0020220777|nr:methionine synthase [Nocardioides bruguierae]MCL8026505.1 methionine synthase [Nocardioides bruguierae]
MSLILPGSDDWEDAPDAAGVAPDLLAGAPFGTAVGSLPGGGAGGGSSAAEDAVAYREAVKAVLGTLGEGSLAPLPELPGRSAYARMIGRTLGAVRAVDADLQPAGWRLTGTDGAPGLDQRRARSLLAQDLDAVEELGQGFSGVVKTQLVGPWTLAATVELPRGEKVLSDHGARRDLGGALAEAVGEHVADLRRRLPDAAGIVVQLDEPSLPAVMNAQVPTASGYQRYRRIDRPEVSALLETVTAAVSAAGAEPWVHSCARGVDWALVRGAGVRGLLVDAAMLTTADHDLLAEALEAGDAVVLGIVPSTDPDPWPSDARLVQRVERWLDMLGLEPGSGRLGVSPGCGLAGASPAWSRRAMQLSASVAHDLAHLG